MPSCLHQHFGLLNISVVMYSCSWGYPTSSLVKNDCEAAKARSCGQTTSCGWAPCIWRASKHGHQSVGYDHLRHCRVGWTVMTHHEGHYERPIRLQKIHFQFDVIRAWACWGANHTGQFLHHPTTSPTMLVWKVVDKYLFLNIIPNNFIVRTGRNFGVIGPWGAMNRKIRPLVTVRPVELGK